MTDTQSAPLRLPPAPPGRTGWPWMDAAPGISPRTGAAPRISIITPSFNQAAFLEETIRSVLLQGYPNLQYIVVDGGSTDGSVEIIKKYAPWLDHWTSEPDRGQSHAINKALARCDSEWFNWINSDDYLLPGALDSVAAAAGAHPSARLITGRLRVVDPIGTAIRSYGVKLTANVTDDIVNHRTAQPAMFYRRAAGLMPDESLHFAMDYGLWVALLAEHGAGAIVNVADELAAFRLHPDSKTSTATDRFENEERCVLCALAKQLGVGSRFLEVLFPAAANVTPLPVCEVGVSRFRLQRAIVRRYLLGDLRRHVRARENAQAVKVGRACLPVAPFATISAAARSWLKRVL